MMSPEHVLDSYIILNMTPNVSYTVKSIVQDVYSIVACNYQPAPSAAPLCGKAYSIKLNMPTTEKFLQSFRRLYKYFEVVYNDDKFHGFKLNVEGIKLRALLQNMYIDSDFPVDQNDRIIQQELYNTFAELELI